MNDATMNVEGHAQRAWPSMVEHRPLRFAATMILYFMQGVPVGLALLVFPAWFAANGASPVEIGAFIAFSLLPWSLKPFVGLLMDRYAYRPMGRRRAWILIAQACMVAVLATLAVKGPGATEIALIGTFCFALNICAIFNDVAVDGMTIDLVPVEERGAINGCMYGSQTVGISATGFLGGQIVLTGGTPATAAILAVVVAVPSLVVALFRERPGERLMPWTSGRPSAECDALQQDRWWPMLKAVLRSLATVRIVAFLAASALFTATWAQLDSVGPTLSVQVLGWSSDDFSNFASTATLAGGFMGIVATGFLIKWFGMVRVATGLALILVVAELIAGSTYSSWQGDTMFMMVFVVQIIAATLLSILMIAWGMMLTNRAIAASQFALIMAIPNLGRSTMSGASGPVIENFGYGASYLVAAALTAAALALFLFAARGHSPRDDPHELSDDGD